MIDKMDFDVQTRSSSEFTVLVPVESVYFFGETYWKRQPSKYIPRMVRYDIE
jgi:hypothetical protein